MTLLITVFAAVICTGIWYRNAPENEMMAGVLCWIYWGAAVMWLVDAVFEYLEKGASYFETEPAEMVNSAALGFSAVALGLVIWIIALLIRDPRGAVKASLRRKR